MSKKTTPELPVIQKTYDLILWYVPILQRLPRDHRYTLGDRMIESLYLMLEELITARYAREKLELLQTINVRLERTRYQTRLLLDFKQMDSNRYLYATKLINEVGVNLGRWINQQKQVTTQPSLSR
ncbi:MAG: diversity-generating retroelement protein Avd [Acidobacteria bacterium]|nr:diversity-generating retroelement protein Avd [Acidobacteriota bacterium]